MPRTMLLAAVCLGLAACATPDAQQTADAGGRDCFRSSDVFGYTIVDDHSVKVIVGPSREYILTTDWNARDLDWTQAVALDSANGLICTGNGLGVAVIGGDPHRRYPISSVARAPEPPAPTGS
jgi:hypothetical protein